MKTAALIYGNDDHYLDHLAPLCSLLDIPLIVTDPSLLVTARTYYPSLSVIHRDYLDITNDLPQLYDQLFYCTPRPLFEEVFFFAQYFNQKRIHTIWCPHGNSDKGHHTSHLEALQQEEAALVYGPQMVELLRQKKIHLPLNRMVITGNFRYQFYLENKSFFDSLAHEHIFQYSCPSARHILYAPTWQDYEGACSFFEATPHLIEQLPANAYLIIKIHPNLLKQKPLDLEAFFHRYAGHPQVLFLNHFPPIYPLLNRIDLYIGDMSSIGYDFLTFDRPLIFLNPHKRNPQTDPSAFLYQCGIDLTPDFYPHIYSQPNTTHLPQKRKEVYQYAFGSQSKPLTKLRQELKQIYDI